LLLLLLDLDILPLHFLLKKIVVFIFARCSQYGLILADNLGIVKIKTDDS